MVDRCENNNQMNQAKIETDKLLKYISLGKAYDAFPKKYFTVNLTSLMNELKGKCDFVNRKGVFINKYLQKLQKVRDLHLFMNFI